jgi:hypothetical protein
MDRRVHLVVLFAAVVALAGCSGGSLGPGTTDAATDAASTVGDDGETATAASGSDAALQTSEAAIQSFSYPDGATPDGITDLDTLLEAHSSALSGDSFIMNGSLVFAISSGGESDSTPVSYTIAYDAADSEVLATVGGLTAGTLSSYSDGSTKYYRIQSESDTEYGVADPDEVVVDGAPEHATGEGLLRTLLQRGNFTATGVVTRDGTELVRYNLTTVQADVDFDVGERSYDGYLLVDSDGIIHEADVSMEAEGNGGFALTYDSHVEFTDIGSTSVEEPSWTSDAG